MKKLVIAALLGVFVIGTASAQDHRDSRYYNPHTGHLDYGFDRLTRSNLFACQSKNHSNGREGHNPPPKPGNSSWRLKGNGDTYIGLRIGPSFTFVSSDDANLNGGTMKTGLNAGVALGTRIASQAPLYLESGLYYTEKGGKGNDGTDGGRFTYNLDYLEIPLLFKYKYSVTDHFRLEPYFGGYFAVGVGGKIKNFGEREAYSSFSGDDKASFKRCDGGLKFGVGASYDMFYAELGYDLGLANICHDYFDTSHNGALQLNFGVNF